MIKFVYLFICAIFVIVAAVNIDLKMENQKIIDDLEIIARIDEKECDESALREFLESTSSQAAALAISIVVANGVLRCEENSPPAALGLEALNAYTERKPHALRPGQLFSEAVYYVKAAPTAEEIDDLAESLRKRLEKDSFK